MAILDWENFERLHGKPGGARQEFENICFELIRKKYHEDGINVQKVHPNPGDDGIDIYTNDIGVEKINVFQCKYFRDALNESQKNQIRNSFITLLANEDIEVQSWTLMFPHDMTIDENLWWCKWKNKMEKKFSVSISCLCGQSLIQELTDYKLYEKYFFNDIAQDTIIGNSILESSNYEYVLKTYAHNYSNVMFLQDSNEPQVRLMDLYIEPEYENLTDNDIFESEETTLSELFNRFICCAGKTFDSSLPILFIEGDAGIGKTSYISKLAYDYLNGIQYGERKIYIVCLRDLVPSGSKINIQNPWLDFFNYLKVNDSFDLFMQGIDKSIIILEGFDELSMVDNIQNDNKSKYLNKLYLILKQYRTNPYIIVTSRPNYIIEENDWNKLKYNKIVVRITHLSDANKQKWIEQAEASGLKIMNKTKKEILDNDQETFKVILGTPFTLYLIVHNQIEIRRSLELWEIYYSIFGKETIERSYDKVAHPSEMIAEFVYQITCKIAFFMHSRNKLDITWDEIEDVINNLDINENDVENMKTLGVINNFSYREARAELRRLLRNNYALHTYYKRSEKGGGLAFIHNYIKDFFVCEYIRRTLESVYKKMDLKKIKKSDVELLNQVFYDLFSANFLNEKVIEFLCSYIRSNIPYSAAQRTSWVRRESGDIVYRVFPVVFSDMLINGFSYGNRVITKIDSECIERPINEAYNLWIIYKELYLLANGKKKKIEMLKNEEFSSGTKVKLFRIMINELLNIKKDMFTNISLQGIDLSSANFSKAKLAECDLNKTNFTNADFSDAIIRNAEMNDSKCLGGDFQECTLSDMSITNSNYYASDFSRANLQNTTFIKSSFVNVLFKETKIEKLRYENVDFSKAIFNKTVLHDVIAKNCKFARTDFQEASFKKTIFTDSIIKFCDFSNSDMGGLTVDSSDLKGCTFKAANMTRADFSDVEFRKCNMDKAIVIGTNFKNTKFIKVTFRTDSLKQALLSSTEFESSNLENANLSNINIKFNTWRNVNLREGRFAYSIMDGCMFKNCMMDKALFNGACGNALVFDNCKLRDSCFIKTQFQTSSFVNSDFSNAIMRNADFRNSDFSNASLQGARLEGAKMNNVNLQGADLSYTSLIGTDLSNANLSGCNFKGTILRGMIIEDGKVGRRGRQTMKTINLNNAKLDNVKIIDIKGYPQEDILDLLQKADCSNADFTDVPEDIKLFLLQKRTEL